MRHWLIQFLLIFCTPAMAHAESLVQRITGEFSYALGRDDHWHYGYKAAQPPKDGKVLFQPCNGMVEYVDVAYITPFPQKDCKNLPRGPGIFQGPSVVIFKTEVSGQGVHVTVIDTAAEDAPIGIGASFDVPFEAFTNALNFSIEDKAVSVRSVSIWTTPDSGAFTNAILKESSRQGQSTAFNNVDIKANYLGNRTFMLAGQGGNIVVAVGQDAVIQVDGEFAPLHDTIKAAVDKLSGSKPIKYLVNTHFHGDHTGGNGPFHRDGTTIVAHRNLALRLEHGATNGLSGQKTAPVEKDAIPTQTYNTNEGITLQVMGQTAQVKHPTSAHTDTDSYVYFPKANVLATGDTVSLGPTYPTIDYANGGSINGIISTVEAYLALGNDQTKYVPGHGQLASKADMQKYYDMLVAVRRAVQAEISAGKTEDQVVADKPLAKIGAELKSPQMVDDNMVKMVYRSLRGARANPA